ncbi:DUF4145 domain-containing protein [Klebsiella pneumoniae]|uniref:DUF4145 domain-containing protein n=1 Tax=Klebsiella pneumoniae complex TaxID=3390273 RepID=UPI00200EE289|nr:DUF4145 domain-containing protein [Klebsiella pneumoniae]MCL0109410.1 DUF4145 domain-containing protein [Klebsiella pneumoniae]MCL0156006.1 DUF4145 domain-containing protein [Klebsiella pneumoniae]MCL0174186.1 DUF4145 domain-containing protein [Klebsiella pneumoniae]MCL0191963.1 DUF4145 domain-containing protein [Klebsiella pneumoniae]MCL0262878.1 DUF4145 domain-containing protein [Klebsiella pneumoniae]
MSHVVEDCPRCGAQKIAFDVRGVNVCGSYRGFHNEDILRYEAFCVCRECSQTTLFLVESCDSQTRLDDVPWQGVTFNFTKIGKIIRAISPADLDYSEPPEHLPKHIHDAYEEGAKCLSIGCYNAAATMFRLCLDYATKGLLPEGEEGPASKVRRSLGLRMEWLLDNKILPEALRELAECVKDDGNDGAHEGILDKETAEDLDDFVYILLERLYTEPQRLVDAKERRKQRKGKK